jgi:hypothetical protein
MLCRSVLVVSTLCALGCSQAFAAEYLDRDNQFKVTIPDGWERITPESDKIDAVLRSPRHETTRGTCALIADPFPATRGMTQNQINEEMAPHINEAFWRGALSPLSTSALIVDEASSELRKGKRVYTTTVRLQGKVDGADVWAQMRATLQIAPDQIAMASCAVWLDHAETEDADMKTVLNSFEGLGAQVVAQRPAMPPAAALLLFAGPRFDGTRHTLSTDSPNLFQTGWSVPTASFALQGYGLWEVCDGMNYRGNCRVLAGAASAASGPNYRPLRIGSARRIALPNDPRNAIGLLSAAVTAQAVENTNKLSRSRRR